jgi:translation initiation factor eIF-2B subunit gamma
VFYCCCHPTHADLDIEFEVLATSTPSLPSNPEDRALIDQQAQISADSIIGHSTRVNKSVVIKASVVGKHCIIGEGATLIGCVLLDHCVIGTRFVFLLCFLLW